MSKYSKEELEKTIKESFSFSEVVRKIKKTKKVHGGMISFFKKKAEKYEIDFSHFKGKPWNKGLVGAPNKMTKEKFLKEYMGFNPLKKTCNTKFKNWIFEFKILKNECQTCGSKNIWMNKILILQLDHIDGNSLNNQIENLRILCPNCHSQTITYAGKNNKKNKQ